MISGSTTNIRSYVNCCSAPPRKTWDTQEASMAKELRAAFHHDRTTDGRRRADSCMSLRGRTLWRPSGVGTTVGRPVLKGVPFIALNTRTPPGVVNYSLPPAYIGRPGEQAPALTSKASTANASHRCSCLASIYISLTFSFSGRE
jgi:hypothetical protein